MWEITGRTAVLCWRWTDGVMTRHSLAIPDGCVHLWDLVNAYGYRSVCQYGDGLITERYHTYEAKEDDQENKLFGTYLALTVIIADNPEAFTHAEIVMLPAWADVLAYRNAALPIVRDAQSSNQNWGERGPS